MRNKLFMLLLVSLLCVSCASKNKKLETHPTNNENALEALDKFWELLRPLRFLNGAVEFN